MAKTNLTAPIVEEFNAFNAKGVHCGHAQWSGTGYCWNVRSSVEHVYADNREQAENWLRSRGAVSFKDANPVRS